MHHLVLLLITLLSATVHVSSMQVPKSKDEYSEDFFRQHEENAPIYPAIASILGNFVVRDGLLGQKETPFSTLDVGCGHGLLVEAWRDYGIKSYGVEGSVSAKSMWPEQYQNEFYQVLDLREADSSNLPKTEVVMTFEVAEHLPEESASRFVELLVSHNPAYVFFGAATINQDLGKNPSHLNENTFSYWINHFYSNGYIPDLVATARIRVDMLQD